MMDFFQRCVKPTAFQLHVALQELSPGARSLAEKELMEAGLI